MNRDGKIDYSAYSLEELQQARRSIDEEKYPLNLQNLMQELASRKLLTNDQAAGATSQSGDIGTPSDDVAPSEPSSLLYLFRRLAILAMFSSYAIASLVSGELFLPTRRGGILLHGISAWMFVIAILLSLFVAVRNVWDYANDSKLSADDVRSLQGCTSLALGLCIASFFVSACANWFLRG